MNQTTFLEETRFRLDPSNEVGVLIDAHYRLEQLLAEEKVEEYQSRFEDMDDESISALVEEIKSEYDGDTEFNSELLHTIGGMVYRIFKDSYRSAKLEGVKIHTMSHFHTPARVAASLGLDFETITTVYMHDMLEEIMDTICVSEYGADLSQVSGMEDEELEEKIWRIKESFPKKRGVSKRDVAQGQTDEYKIIRHRVLGIINKEFQKKMKRGLFSTVSALEYRAEILRLYAITRIPGEPYDATVARIQDLNTYLRVLLFHALPKSVGEDPESLRMYVESLRINVIEGKLLDGLHNLATQGPILVPELGQGQERGFGASLDNRMKYLLKRLYIIDYTKDVLLEKADSDLFVEEKYHGIYGLHLLLAYCSEREASEISGQIYEEYAERQVKDKNVKKKYGFRPNRNVIFGMIFDKIKEKYKIYESKGFLKGVTNYDDNDELDFKREHKVGFGGTIRKINRYSDEKGTDLYHDFMEEDDIIECFKDNYALSGVFKRYTGVNVEGEVIPGLNTFHLQGFGLR